MIKILNYSEYLTDGSSEEIPKDLIIHGIPTVNYRRRQTIVKILEIDIGTVYIVNFTNTRNLEMQLGYFAKDLDMTRYRQGIFKHL